MKVNGGALITDDGNRTFEQAYAQLEAAFESATSAPPAPEADLNNCEDGLTNRQLGATPPTEAAAGAPAHLALVPPFTETPGEKRRPAAVAPLVDELWRAATGAGTPLERLVETMQNLVWLQRVIHSRAHISDRVTYADVSAVFSNAQQLCVDFDLPTARVRAGFARAAFETDRLDLLAEEIGELVRHIRQDLQSCSLWPIAQKCLWAYSLAPGDRARRAFPTIVQDIAEGGRCAAFGFHTASVFHMLRAAACGSRALETAAAGRRAASERPSWTSTIGLVEAQVAAVSHWPDSTARAAAIGFYTSALNDARTLHDAECRLAAGASFDEQHALAIVNTVREFLTRLAAYVTQYQTQPLTQQDFAAVGLQRD
jgi:hypothetical protein